jgi:glycerol-3-phosphate acyltransferase PlsY
MSVFDPSSWGIAGLAALSIGYLLGSIPFGLLITRMAGLGDIRAIGSGNIGATNVLRTGRKGLAAATLLADALKGTAGVAAGGLIAPEAAVLGGFAAFLGHLFPVWLRFRGGKGVATYIGVLLGLWWPAVLLFAAVWLSVARISRYSSLAALSATAVVAAAALAVEAIAPSALPRVPQGFGLAVVAMTALVFLKHHENIRRLIAGKESKIGGSHNKDSTETNT